MTSRAPTSSQSEVRIENLQAERALLGGALLDNGYIAQIERQLPEAARQRFHDSDNRNGRRMEDDGEPLFADSRNQIVFETITALNAEVV